MADRRVSIELTDEAREWLAREGYDRLYGARPLARVIQDNIKKPLANELLFGKLAKGGVVRVSVDDGKLSLSFPEAEADDKKTEEPALVE